VSQPAIRINTARNRVSPARESLAATLTALAPIASQPVTRINTAHSPISPALVRPAATLTALAPIASQPVTRIKTVRSPTRAATTVAAIVRKPRLQTHPTLTRIAGRVVVEDKEAAETAKPGT
jgi:hypothetical protein